MKTHRQGRTGAGKRALRRVHAYRLLLALAGICRQVRAAQADAQAIAAAVEVEQQILKLAAKTRKGGDHASS